MSTGLYAIIDKQCIDSMENRIVHTIGCSIPFPCLSKNLYLLEGVVCLLQFQAH